MKESDFEDFRGSGNSEGAEALRERKGSESFRGWEFYHGEQAREVIRYVREEYGDELEFLWQDENGVWRNPRNRKWYGAMLKVKGARLGLSTDEVVEVLDLRFEKGMAREFVASFGVSKSAGGVEADASFGGVEADARLGGVRADVRSGGVKADAGPGGVGILLGYHMNKDNWITVVLDYGVATEEVLALVDKSYQIVAEGK